MYKIIWQIQLMKTVDVDSPDEALLEAENLDCQCDGEYVGDSFEIISITKE